MQKRRRDHTGITAKHQITIPAAVLAESGLAIGDEVRFEVEGNRLVLVPERSLAQRRLAAIEETAGCLTGVYSPGDLDELRAEWR